MNNTEVIFIEAPESFHDVHASSWIPFLPMPGEYKHPTFGDVIIDANRNQRMVESVKEKVYQDRVPIDIEHDLKGSGAVGWVSDMRMNPDGSADAYVEWTDRGQEVLKSKRFRYISPEWFRQWKDPASGTEFQDVVAGGALTTRPFFKDKVLRALVASERGVEIVGRETFAGDNNEPRDERTEEDEDEEETGGGVATMVRPEDEAEEEEFEDEEEEDDESEEEEQFMENLTPSAADIEQYVEGRIEAVQQSFAEQLKEERGKRENAESALKVLREERRREKFTELVRGRDAGAPWIGGIDKHVPVLETFADTFGEESKELKDYIELQAAAAIQLKESQAFAEIGSSAVGSPSSAEPVSRLEAMAEEHRKANPGMTKEQAFSEVVSTPDGARLYAETVR